MMMILLVWQPVGWISLQTIYTAMKKLQNRNNTEKNKTVVSAN